MGKLRRLTDLLYSFKSGEVLEFDRFAVLVNRNGGTLREMLRVKEILK